MTDTSGPTSGKQFAYYDPDSQSWRMWPATGLWGSIAYSETWPRTGFMSDGRAYELPTLVPPTTASDCSSSRHLPTPTAAKAGNDLSLTKSGDGREVPNKLGWAIAKMLPTPRTTDATNSMTAPSAMKHVADGFGTLPEVIGAKLLPTPKASDFQDKTSPADARRKAPALTAVSVHFPTPTASDATGGGQHPSKRVGHTRQLIDTVLGLTSGPTPPLFDDGSD